MKPFTAVNNQGKPHACNATIGITLGYSKHCLSIGNVILRIKFYQMNRRNSLATLLGRSTSAKGKTFNSTISLNPYQGPWTFDLAARLLRRTTYGPNKALIEQAVSNGLESIVSTLLQDLPLPSPPVYYDFENDPNVPLGSTWIDELVDFEIEGIGGGRKRSMRAWSFKLMHEEQISIREKMVMFWHNHFVVFSPGTGRRMYKYMDLLRNNALGNFRTLVEGITVDSAMLLYLNGTSNSRFGANENYARELLELFTIGKGPAAGPGDYTNYTEDDVVAIAKALTGWRHFRATDQTDVNDVSESSFVENRHDGDDKQLSHRFDNVIISNEGENEYKRVIDIILSKDEVARHLSRKLIRWFVHPTINDDIEQNIVEPMAQIIIQDNYEIKRAMRALLSSEFFFDESIRGCMITNPIDHMFKVIKTFNVAMPDDYINAYQIYRYWWAQAFENQMTIFRHPSVAGWPALYQAPQFDKLWINAVSLPKRQNTANLYVNGFNRNGWRLEIDVIKYAESISDPYDINVLINETAQLIFSYPLSDEQLTALKNVVIPGLPDYEWTIEYGEFVGGDASLEDSIKNKLKDLLGTMLKMPEFYLH